MLDANGRIVLTLVDDKTSRKRSVSLWAARIILWTVQPQVTGFGLLHDGTFDTVVSFLRLDVFLFPGRTEAEKDTTRRLLESYIMAFDTGMAPAVGRQVTIAEKIGDEDRYLIDLLMKRAIIGDCDLVARVWEGKRQRGIHVKNT